MLLVLKYIPFTYFIIVSLFQYSVYWKVTDENILSILALWSGLRKTILCNIENF